MPTLSVSNLTVGGTTGVGDVGTTASVAPTSNALQLLSVGAYMSSGSLQPPTPTITGNGLTWQLEASVDIDASGTDRETRFLFSAHGPSPSTGSITIDFGTAGINRMDWILDEAIASDGGTSSVVQTATSQFASGSTSGQLFLAPFANANLAYATFEVQKSNSVTLTFTAGTNDSFILAGQDAGSGRAMASATEWMDDEPFGDEVDMSWTASGSVFRSAAIAVEIEAIGDGGGSPTPVAATWDVGYDIAASLARTWDVGYDIGGSLSRTWDIQYDLQAFLAKTWDVKYDLLTGIARTWDVPYDVQAGTANQWAVVYDLGEILGPLYRGLLLRGVGPA